MCLRVNCTPKFDLITCANESRAILALQVAIQSRNRDNFVVSGIENLKHYSHLNIRIRNITDLKLDGVRTSIAEDCKALKAEKRYFLLQFAFLTNYLKTGLVHA